MRRCRSLVGWVEPGKARLLDSDLVRYALEKVRLIEDWLSVVQSIHKSYADRRACDVTFMVGERILLKVSLKKGMMRFEKKDFNLVQLNKDLTYVEELAAILDRLVQKLRSKNIDSMKVQ
ncbi:uncharacterized protein LOC142164318 [Nicotiana tabacum]|uniref:Uncharacterized protein LOC142164318 n=1 Tax=Nicotiana tabacum TaxID=4097 RepID=A0AC58S0A6_TOBAC